MELWELHEAVALVAPIHGLDSNGKISFKDEATADQRKAAQAVVKKLVPAVNDDKPEVAHVEIAQPVIEAIDERVAEEFKEEEIENAKEPKEE